MKRGEIRWANVPAEHSMGHETRDHGPGIKRPYVIVSDGRLERGGCVLGVPLSTQATLNPPFGPFRVRVGVGDVRRTPEDAGDVADSVALCDQVRPLALGRFDGRRLGTLTGAVLADIERALMLALGLPG